MNLFETMLVVRGKIVHLDEHAARMGVDANAFRNAALSVIRDEPEHAIRVVYKDGALTATAFAIPEVTLSRRAHGRVVTLPPTTTRPLPQYKRYPEDLHLRDLIPPGADEALFVTPDGHILEGTSTNIFAIRGDTLITPPNGVLPGIMRDWVIRNAPKVEYRALTIDDLLRGAFLTSSLTGVAAIHVVNGQVCESPTGDFEQLRVTFPTP